jgi:hypothetical protein
MVTANELEYQEGVTAYKAGWEAGQAVYYFALRDMMADAWMANRHYAEWHEMSPPTDQHHYMLCNEMYLRGIKDSLEQAFELPVTVEGPRVTRELHIKVCKARTPARLYRLGLWLDAKVRRRPRD